MTEGEFEVRIREYDENLMSLDIPSFKLREWIEEMKKEFPQVKTEFLKLMEKIAKTGQVENEEEFNSLLTYFMDIVQKRQEWYWKWFSDE